MTASQESVRAFSIARALLPGTKRTVRKRNLLSAFDQDELAVAHRLADLPGLGVFRRIVAGQRVFHRGELLATLVDEWKRALPLLPVWHRGRREEMEAALERARARKDIRQGYEELQAAIQLRKGSV